MPLGNLVGLGSCREPSFGLEQGVQHQPSLGASNLIRLRWGEVRFRDPFDVEIGRRLRLLRRAAGRSLVDVGAPVGVSETMLSRYELGVAAVSTATLARICAQLEVSPSVVLADVDTVVGISAGNGPADLPEMAQALLQIEDLQVIGSFLALLQALAAEA